MDLVFWTLLPAFGVAYVVTGSELTELPRLYLQTKFPRSLGALVVCAPCSGFWAGAVVVRLAVELGLATTAVGRCILAGLAVTGALWILSAFSGGLAGIAQSVLTHAKAQTVGVLDQLVGRKPLPPSSAVEEKSE